MHIFSKKAIKHSYFIFVFFYQICFSFFFISFVPLFYLFLKAIFISNAPFKLSLQILYCYLLLQVKYLTHLFLKKPKICIFDESTSFLDKDTDFIIQNNIEKFHAIRQNGREPHCQHSCRELRS